MPRRRKHEEIESKVRLVQVDGACVHYREDPQRLIRAVVRTRKVASFTVVSRHQEDATEHRWLVLEGLGWYGVRAAARLAGIHYGSDVTMRSVMAWCWIGPEVCRGQFKFEEVSQSVAEEMTAAMGKPNLHNRYRTRKGLPPGRKGFERLAAATAPQAIGAETVSAIIDWLMTRPDCESRRQHLKLWQSVAKHRGIA